MNLPDLHFVRPWWLLALLPLALLLWRLARRNTGAANWQGLVDPHLLPQLLVPGSAGSRRLAPLLLGLGWLLLVLALAGPSWERLPQPVYQAQQYRVLLLDISQEMNSADVPPSRLAQARFETLDLLGRSGEGQTALIAYAAEPYVIAPLTRDADTIKLQVPALSSDLLPLQGRNAGPALARALQLLNNARAQNGEVILITGGMDDPAAAQAAARELHQAGHRLSVLAVGTEAGAPVPTGDGGFLQDADGAIVLPRLNPQRLTALADNGGGRYMHSRPDDRDLDALLHQPIAPAQAEQQSDRIQGDQWRELSPWLLLALLPLAALAFRRGWFSPLLLALGLGLGLLAPPQPAQAFGWDDLWSRADQRGARAMAVGQPEQAAELFNDPAWRAAAHYRSGQFQEGLAELDALSDSESAYNRGNSLAHLGELARAIAAYDQVLEQQPEHRDAQFNRDLLRQLLNQQQDPQQQSGENQDSGESGEGEQQQGENGSQSEAEQPSEQQKQDQGAGQSQQGEQPQDGSESQPPAGEDKSETSQQEQSQSPSETGQQGEKPPAQEPGRADLLGDEQPGGEAQATAGFQPEEGQIPESTQAMEQWLRRVPDDPAGLLRQRILLQHLRNRGELP